MSQRVSKKKITSKNKQNKQKMFHYFRPIKVTLAATLLYLFDNHHFVNKNKIRTILYCKGVVEIICFSFQNEKHVFP